MNELYAYFATLVVYSLGKSLHLSNKILSMASHFPGEMFTLRPFKSITGDEQAAAACSEITVEGSKLWCRPPLLLPALLVQSCRMTRDNQWVC